MIMAVNFYAAAGAGARHMGGSASIVRLAGANWARFAPSEQLNHRSGVPANILIPDPVDTRALALLAKAGAAFTVLCPDSEPLTDPVAQLQAVAKADPGISVVMPFVKYQFKEPVLGMMPALQAVCHWSTGYDNSDGAYIKNKGLAYTYAPGPLTNAMAELTTGLILDSHFRITDSIAQERETGIPLEYIASYPTDISSQQTFAQFLFGLFLSRVLRLQDMYDFVRGGRFVGCGVGSERTIFHDQLAMDKEAGIERTVGVLVPEETRGISSMFTGILAPIDANPFGLKDLEVSPNIGEHDYIIRLPFARRINNAQNVLDPNTVTIRHGFEQNVFSGPSLTALTLSLVGFGRIGSAVAVRAQALGMNIVAYDPYLPQEARAGYAGVRFVDDKESLLRWADFLVMIPKLTDETRGWLGERELAMLKPNAAIINTSRGPVVDEGAVMAHLNSRPLARYMADVLVDEANDTDKGLARLPNARITGHTGSAAGSRDGIEGPAVRLRMQTLAIEQNILPIVRGEQPTHPIQ